VVGGGVGAGVPGSQQDRQRLTGAVRAVVAERPERVMPVPVFERRRRTFLVRVRGHQGGVHVDHDRPRGIDPSNRTVLAGQPPHPSAGHGAAGVDRPQRSRGVRGQRVDRAGDRRVRGPRPEHARLGADHGDIGQAVPTQAEGDRQIQQHFRRVVDRQRRTPPGQRRRQRRVQDRGPDRGRQQRPTGLTNDTPARTVDPNPRIEPATLTHLESAPRTGSEWTLSKSYRSSSGALFTSRARRRDQAAMKAAGEGRTLAGCAACSGAASTGRGAERS
jgi:hypothetical protein